MTSAHRLGAFLLALVTVAPVPARAQIEPEWRSDVAALLRRRSAAVMRGDERAFVATMAGAPQRFVDARVRSFRGLRALPLRSYSLRLDPDGYRDLAGALVRRPRGDEVHVVQAQERIALAEYDRTPSVEEVYLTVVRRGARWSIVADDDLDGLGLLSARYLWDFGSVRRLDRGRVLVLTRGDARTAARMADATRAAVAHVARAWPYRFPRATVLAIPRTAKELQRIFATTVDLGPFVAFAASSIDRPDGGYALSGHRVYVQPDNFFGHSASFQRETMRHELLHVATRAQAGAFTPSWLDEGVALVYGEGRAPAPTEIRRRIRAGTFDGELPIDAMFFVGPDEDIQYAYQAGGSFVSYLRRRFGARAGARFYRAVGAEMPVSFGTGRYHLDRAARATFDTSFGSLERAWARSLRRELG